MSIQLNNAIFGYGRREVVHVTQLQTGPGECIGIYGPNGAGKTTLVRGMCGLIEPIAGEVEIDKNARMGLLPQARSLQLHWPMSGLDVAMLASSARQTFGISKQAGCALQQALRDLKVSDLVSCRFSLLSGGQQQRLLLAGAIADHPDVLVLDEPCVGLDAQSQSLLLEAVQRAMSKGLSVVLISHDFADLLRLARQVLLLEPQESGPTKTSLHDPRELARSLFGQEVIR